MYKVVSDDKSKGCTDWHWIISVQDVEIWDRVFLIQQLYSSCVFYSWHIHESEWWALPLYIATSNPKKTRSICELFYLKYTCHLYVGCVFSEVEVLLSIEYYYTVLVLFYFLLQVIIGFILKLLPFIQSTISDLMGFYWIERQKITVQYTIAMQVILLINKSYLYFFIYTILLLLWLH